MRVEAEWDRERQVTGRLQERHWQRLTVTSSTGAAYFRRCNIVARPHTGDSDSEFDEGSPTVRGSTGA